MKRFAVGFMAALALFVASVPTYADAIGTPGKPIYVVSNPGSVQGQTHRSKTGSTMKETHDRAEFIWD